MFTCVMHRFTRFHHQDPLGSFNRIHHLDTPQDPRQDPPQGSNKICLKNPTWIAIGFHQNTRSIRVPQRDVASGSTPGSTPGSTNRIHHLNLSLSSFQGNQESLKKHQEPLQRSTWIQQTDPPTGSTRIHNMNSLRSTNEIHLDPSTGQIWIHKNLFGVTLIHSFRPNIIEIILKYKITYGRFSFVLVVFIRPYKSPGLTSHRRHLEVTSTEISYEVVMKFPMKKWWNCLMKKW